MVDRYTPDHDAKLTLALERAKVAQEQIVALKSEIVALKIEAAEDNEKLRVEMNAGFEKMAESLAKISLQHASRAGAERLGAWLLGAFFSIGAIGATVWTSMHTTPHH